MRALFSSAIVRVAARSAVWAGLFLIVGSAAFATPTLTLSSGAQPTVLLASPSGAASYNNAVGYGGWIVNSVQANGTPYPTYGNASNPSLNLTVNVKAIQNVNIKPLVITFTDDNFVDTTPVNFVASLSGNNLTSGMSVSYTAFLNGSPLGSQSTTALATPSVYDGIFGGTYTQLTPYTLSLKIVITPNVLERNSADLGFSFDGTAAPEPTFYSALGIGLLALAFFRRRQRA
jgi:hypothetical protein